MMKTLIKLASGVALVAPLVSCISDTRHNPRFDKPKSEIKQPENDFRITYPLEGDTLELTKGEMECKLFNGIFTVGISYGLYPRAEYEGLGRIVNAEAIMVPKNPDIVNDKMPGLPMKEGGIFSRDYRLGLNNGIQELIFNLPNLPDGNYTLKISAETAEGRDMDAEQNVRVLFRP